MTTPRDILQACLAHDAAIDVELITSHQSEIVSEIGRVLRKAMNFGIKRNPAYFGAVKNVALAVQGAISGWKLPDDTYALYRIEAAGDTKDEAATVIANGTPIEVVPFSDRAWMLGTPAVYLFGRNMIRAGNAGDPASGSLNFFYAAKPVVPTSVVTNLDERWPEDMNDLLVAEMNAWFARRDGRSPELYDKAAGDWYILFEEWLGNIVLNTSLRNEEFRPALSSAKPGD